MFDLAQIPQAVQAEGRFTRRLALAYGAALAGLPLVASRMDAADRKFSFAADPFSLGVASGDPDSSSLVLWTKLAPDPQSPDGGLKPERISVGWQIAEDEAMTKVVSSGTAVAAPQLGQ